MHILLVKDTVQLPHVQAESLCVQYLQSLDIDDRNDWYVYDHFKDAFLLKANNARFIDF